VLRIPCDVCSVYHVTCAPYTMFNVLTSNVPLHHMNTTEQTLLRYYSKFDRDRFPFHPDLLLLPSFNRCSASTVCRLIPSFGTKMMSNEHIFRITANILSFQPYVRNKHNLLSDPDQILSSTTYTVHTQQNTILAT
jgi:hypothetical protein